MTDLTSELLPLLKADRLPELDLGPDFQYPHYNGLSILNVPSGMCKLLGAPEFGAPALKPELLTPLGEGVRRVVIVLVDALGFSKLQSWGIEKKDSVWSRLLEGGVLAPITSISPSTTSAALTTLWTGRPPGQHGIAGYETWLKEYGVVANMIEHKPITFAGRSAHLGQAGFQAKHFLPAPTLGPHLKEHGIQGYLFQHFSISGSGLSEMFSPEVSVHGFATPADQWTSVRQLLESKPGERIYVGTYWDAVDTLSHIHGPDEGRAQAEFEHFSAALEQFLLKGLSAEARKDTALILIADHGQITTTAGDPFYSIENHPSLGRRIHMITGENRLAYLYVRPGQMEAVREYIEKTWPNQFAVVESANALHGGLFGPEPFTDLIHDRIGDLIVLAKGNAYLWWHPKQSHLVGRHGGLHPEEMLVPFLGARLDY